MVVAMHRGVNGSLEGGALRYLGYAPQHFLYFFPDPQGQGSFLPGSFSPCGEVLALGAVDEMAREAGPPEASAEGWTYLRLRSAAGVGACDGPEENVSLVFRSDLHVVSAARAIISWNMAKDSRLKAMRGSVPP